MMLIWGIEKEKQNILKKNSIENSKKKFKSQNCLNVASFTCNQHDDDNDDDADDDDH